jgi:5,10-methylenetetrahydrofolate reductase
VFVGASSKSQKVTLSLRDACELKTKVNTDLLLGGVTIPERHQSKGDEHIRVFRKISQGCAFFVSQGVYDVNASKNFLSDYYYYGQEHNIPLVPILFTLTPCDSLKTLQFMKWLGVSIPK